MQLRLSPGDVAVALRLAAGSATLAQLGEELALSTSQVRTAIERLIAAGLVRPGSRELNRLAFSEFLIHGARYAFPAELGSEARGIPTAHSAPDLADEIDADEQCVWPCQDGDVVGRALTPLYAGAAKLRDSSPFTYRLVALFDAVRAGSARERKLAIAKLEKALEPPLTRAAA